MCGVAVSSALMQAPRRELFHRPTHCTWPPVPSCGRDGRLAPRCGCASITCSVESLTVVGPLAVGAICARGRVWVLEPQKPTPHRLSSVDRPKRRQRRQRQRLRRRRRRRLVVMEGSYQDKSKAAAAAAAAVVVPSRATSNVTVAKPWRDLQLLEAGALRPFERPTNFTTAGLRRAPPYATLSNCFFTYVGPG